VNRFLVLVFAWVAVASCSSANDRVGERSGTSLTSPSSTLPAVTTPQASPTSSAPVCAHSPIAQVRDSYSGLPNARGVSLDYLATHAYEPTKDDDGNTIRSVDLSIEKSGPDGTVTLTHGGSHDVVVMRGVGDFDGDGRSDLVVDIYESGTVTATYIVPGTVAPGTHDPIAVGVRVPPPRGDEAGATARPIGDQNHDGADDLSFGTALYSGRQLMATPARATLPTPFRTLASPYVGLLQLDPHQPPTFVVPDEATSSVHVLDARSDRLLLDARPNDLSFSNGLRAVGWLVNGRHIVQLDYSTRSGETAWRWDIDAACV
jgi:hypothetical protein